MNSNTQTRNLVRSARGNTLVGLMIGLAIVEISGTAVVSALSQFQKQATVLDAKNNSASLVAEMGDELSKLSTCTSAINTTQPLVKDPTGGFYPISMTVPSLSGVPIADGSSRPLDDYNVTTKRFYLNRLTDTLLKGPNNLPLYVGDVMVQFQSLTDNNLSMRSQTVSQLFLEIDNMMIKSCASGDDPTVALAMACARVGGTYTIGGTCNMDAVRDSIVAYSRAKVNAKLTDYANEIYGKMQPRIDGEASKTEVKGTTDANGYTKQNADALNSTIQDDSLLANNSLTKVNDTLNTDVSNLWNGIANVNNQSAYAQAVTNNANDQTGAANFWSNNSRQAASFANQLATNGIQQSNAADAASQAANATAGQANQTTQASNATSNWTMGTAGAANYYSAVTQNETNAANNATNAANNASSSANNAANTAWYVSNAANQTSGRADGGSNYSYTVANAANGGSNYANAISNDANYWSNASLARQSYTNNTSSSETRNCIVGGGSCLSQ